LIIVTSLVELCIDYALGFQKEYEQSCL
jgi:hypothetical protein